MGGGVSPNEKVRSSVPQLKKKKKERHRRAIRDVNPKNSSKDLSHFLQKFEI